MDQEKARRQNAGSEKMAKDVGCTVLLRTVWQELAASATSRFVVEVWKAKLSAMEEGKSIADDKTLVDEVGKGGGKGGGPKRPEAKAVRSERDIVCCLSVHKFHCTTVTIFSFSD